MYLYVFLCLLVLVLFSVELICFVSFFYCFLAVLSINRPICIYIFAIVYQSQMSNDGGGCRRAVE